MNRIPAIQKDVVAHLRSAGRPESSRALAARFLRIENGDEETCRRLLAPFLATVPGIVHRPEEGWSLVKLAPGTAPERAREVDAVPVGDANGRREAQALRDFVALASEGTGPGGSGEAAAVTLLPVVAGDECQEERFPAGDPEDEIRTPDAPAGSRLTPAVLEDMVQTIGDLPVVCHRVAREVEPLRRLCAAAGIPFQAPVISAAKLGHLLLGLKSNHPAADLAQALGMESRGPDDGRGRARIVAGAFLRLVPLLEARGIDTVDALLEYQDMPAPPLDLSAYAFTAEDLKTLPAGPGVYRFLDREGRVIYVGKAKNLRVRVGSYFVPSARGAAKGRAILEQVHRLRFDPVASELEANLLEAALIAEHHPPLNRQFDVHERPAPYGPRLNLVVVLQDAASAAAERPTCTMHFLKGGLYLKRLGGFATDSAAPVESWKEALNLLARHYFPSSTRTGGVAGGKRPDASAGADGVDIDWQLVSSFVRKYRDEVNVLDVDECASVAEAEGRLRVLVRGAGSGRIVAR
jgi:hypothetical protein